MSTMGTTNKYDGEPKTMIEILKEFVWNDWNLLEDMAEKAIDKETLIYLTEAACMGWGSLDDGYSDMSYEVVTILAANPNLPEEAKKSLIENGYEDGENE
jgi:hypothetical protein